ncbi:unnamed protein product, partial [Effrenium voratum]
RIMDLDFLKTLRDKVDAQIRKQEGAQAMSDDEYSLITETSVDHEPDHLLHPESHVGNLDKIDGYQEKINQQEDGTYTIKKVHKNSKPTSKLQTTIVDETYGKSDFEEFLKFKEWQQKSQKK